MLVDLSNEHTHARKLMQWFVQKEISTGLDQSNLSLNSKRSKPLSDNLGLAQCKRAATASDDQFFRQVLNASNVASMTSSEWAAEMKSVSYWLGVRNTPFSNIRWKNAR